LCDVFLELGKTCGKESEAKRLIDDSAKRDASIKTKIGKAGKPSTLVQIGSTPLFVATRAFFLNDYVMLAGGTNIFADLKSGTVSFEQAVAGNPDVIIIAGMGLSGEAERRSWERFDTINAVRNKRIYVVDADKLCSPTPVSFADYLHDLARMLHPEVFR
jgi:iron complex transport system substrate-binding protein